MKFITTILSLALLICSVKSEQAGTLYYAAGYLGPYRGRRRLLAELRPSFNARDFNVEYAPEDTSLATNEMNIRYMISDINKLTNNATNADKNYVIFWSTVRVEPENSEESGIDDAYVFETGTINGPGFSITIHALYVDEGTSSVTTVPFVVYTVLGAYGIDQPDFVKIDFDNDGTADWNINKAVRARRVNFVYNNHNGNSDSQEFFNAEVQMDKEMNVNNEHGTYVIHVGGKILICMYIILAIVMAMIFVCVYFHYKQRKGY
eukprot:51796_1